MKRRSDNTIVIKVGSSVLSGSKGELSTAAIQRIAEQVAELKRRGHRVIIVSSGAVMAGMKKLGRTQRPEYLPEIQACAAVGQAALIQTYDRYLSRHGLAAAQVLLIQDDMTDRRRYLNARNTLSALLRHDIIPVINENDTVSIEEIKFGDNDRLSSLVASLIDANRLIMLSDVDGLYEMDAHKKSSRRLVREVPQITEDVEAMAGDGCSRFGTGGMCSKIQAAKIAVNAGIECAIVNGHMAGVLIDTMEDRCPGTIFRALRPRISARKRWIAYSCKPKGEIVVDAGAREVLRHKQRSLLASGITNCKGSFAAGDSVSIVGPEGKEFARGIAGYSFAELKKIRGRNTRDIEKILGYKYYDEVVHRDNLVIL